MLKLSILDISKLLDGACSEGDLQTEIVGPASILEAKGDQLSFLSNMKYEDNLYTTSAGAILVDKGFRPRKAVSTILIEVENAYLSFALYLEQVEKSKALSKKGLDTMTSIHDSAKIGKNAYVGAFTSIGENTVIGDNVKIYPNVTIGDRCEIGSNSIVYAGAKIYQESIIGSHCAIHAGAVIGSDGFGFAPQSDGSYIPIPQVGQVILENHVSIGANTVIDRATLDATIIRSGVKLDNLIQIAHNVEIGKNTAIAAQTGVSGSTRIGEGCVIGGQVGMGGHLQVADGTKVGGKTGITKSIKEQSILFGNPAMNLRDYNKSYALYKKLPEVMERIERLEQKLLT